jgi:hypothetical protein
MVKFDFMNGGDAVMLVIGEVIEVRLNQCMRATKQSDTYLPSDAIQTTK